MPSFDIVSKVQWAEVDNALQGILQRDYPVAQATVVLGAALFVLSSFVVDLLYAWVDPRIRYR